MDLLVYIIALFVSGLIVGALGRLVVPGPDPIGCLPTALVGMAGSFGAGLFTYYVLDRDDEGSFLGLVLAVVFAALLVYLLRRLRGRGDERVTLPPR